MGRFSNAADGNDTPRKRGRKARPPNPDDGPLAAFAHELWALKRRAGDPSFATMSTRLGAAASKSSLAAATHGTVLPSWETTWEFVRVLAVDQLGADAEETQREWLARWEAAGAATDPANTTDPAPPDPSAGERVQPKPVFWSTRNKAVVAAAAALVIAGVGLGSLVSSSPAPVPGEADAAQLDDATFESDVTFPDGSVVAPGQTFTKVWQLRNTGLIRWTGRYLTRVNSTPCQAPDMVPIPVTDPGNPVRIEVPVTASESPAHCKIFWKMTDGERRILFPDKNPIFLDVVVRDQE